MHYISRTLSDAEKSFLNIEREGLATVWSCDKIKEFIFGKTISIEIDHKPLLKIFTNKHLDDLFPRLQRMKTSHDVLRQEKVIAVPTCSEFLNTVQYFTCL